MSVRAGGVAVLLVLPCVAAAQDFDPSPDLLLAELRTVPAAPGIGDPFDVHLTLRVPRTPSVTLSDTLLAAEWAESYGTGQWSEVPVPGDSLEIAAVFPVIAFREGIVLLPSLELHVEEAGAGGRDRRTLRLGAVRVADLESEFGEGALEPRPPAGVLGSGWSIWTYLAAGAWSMAGAVTVGAAGVRWRRRRADAAARASLGGTPRERALLALDRIYRSRAHHEGGIVPFYGETTDVIRRLCGELDGALGLDLTSGELIAAIEARWGEGRAQGVAYVVDTAESVKFGRLRPEPEVAERDWARVREWVLALPERP